MQIHVYAQYTYMVFIFIFWHKTLKSPYKNNTNEITDGCKAQGRFRIAVGHWRKTKDEERRR